MGAAITLKPTVIETLPTFKQLQNAVTNYDAKDARAAEKLSKALKAFTLDQAAPSADKARTLRSFIGNPISIPPSFRDELRRTVVAMNGTSFQIAESRLRTVITLRKEVIDMTETWNGRIDSLRQCLRDLTRADDQGRLLGRASEVAKRAIGSAASATMREVRLFKGLLADIDTKLVELGSAVKTVLAPIGSIKMPEMSHVEDAQKQVQSATTMLLKIEAAPLSFGDADDALAVTLTDSRRLVRSSLEMI